MKKIIFLLTTIILLGFNQSNAYIDLSCPLNNSYCNVEKSNIKNKEKIDKVLTNFYINTYSKYKNYDDLSYIYGNFLNKIKDKRNNETIKYLYDNISSEKNKIEKIKLYRNNNLKEKDLAFIKIAEFNDDNKYRNINQYYSILEQINVEINKLEKLTLFIGGTQKTGISITNFRSLIKDIKIEDKYNCLNNTGSIEKSNICKNILSSNIKDITTPSDKIKIGKSVLLYKYLVSLNNHNNSNIIADFLILSNSVSNALIDLKSNQNDKEIDILIGNNEMLKKNTKLLKLYLNKKDFKEDTNIQKIKDELYDIFVELYKQNLHYSINSFHDKIFLSSNKQIPKTDLINITYDLDNTFIDNFYTDGLITSLKISNDAENTKILREIYKYILEFGVDNVQEKKLFEFRTGTITKKVAFIQGIDIGVKIMDFYYNGIDKLAPQGFIDDFYKKLDTLNNYNKNLTNTFFN